MRCALGEVPGLLDGMGFYRIEELATDVFDFRSNSLARIAGCPRFDSAIKEGAISLSCPLLRRKKLALFGGEQRLWLAHVMAEGLVR